MANQFSITGATPMKTNTSTPMFSGSLSSFSAQPLPAANPVTMPTVKTQQAAKPSIGTSTQTTPGLLNMNPTGAQNRNSITDNSPTSSGFINSTPTQNWGVNSPAPSTPVKSTTQSNVDGSSTKTEYHPESQPASRASPSSSGYNNPNGVPVSNGVDYSGTNQAQVDAEKARVANLGQAKGYLPANQGTTGVNQGGIIGNLLNYGQNESPQVQQERQRLKDLQNEYAQKGININQTAGFLTQANGEQGLLQGQYNTANAAEQQALANALTSQGQQITATQGAGSLNAPIQQSYSSMLVNPATGQPYSQSGGTLQEAISSVVQKLQNGQMTYNDAISALSGYGQGGMNALQQALPQGFNIAQSNTLGAQQGSIGVNYQLADSALKNVEGIINQLMPTQNTNIPLINKAGNWFSTQFGVNSKETRAMTGAVQSLRNAYASLLASSKGGTPTDYSGQAQAEIPNEPTPNDIAAIRQNFETLGKARANILGNPGQSGTQNNSSQASSNLYSW